MKWGFQTTPHDGWDYRRRERVHLVRPQQGRQDHQGRRHRRPQRLLLCARPRPTASSSAATPFVEKITWAKGIDNNGRPIYNDDNRPGDPAKSADGKKGKKSSRFRPSSAARTRCRSPIPTRPSCSMCPRTNGAWTSTTSRSSTRRARPILGAGFNIKPIFDDHIGSLKAIDPVAEKMVVGIQEQGSAVGRRADHRRRPRLHRHA